MACLNFPKGIEYLVILGFQIKERPIQSEGFEHGYGIKQTIHEPGGKMSIKFYLTVRVVPTMSTTNLVRPLAAGPETNEPSELNVEPCAAHKNDDFVLLYSTVDPAWGQTDDTAKKLEAVFPVAIRIKMIPFLAI